MMRLKGSFFYGAWGLAPKEILIEEGRGGKEDLQRTFFLRQSLHARGVLLTGGYCGEHMADLG